MSNPPGASGYFSAPSDTLDPNLFDGDRLKPNVRSYIHNHLMRWFQELGMRGAGVSVFIVGSGITYQWAADRGNGDLDVMLQINLAAFQQANHDYAGWGQDQLADGLNKMLHESLWPQTAAAAFGDRTYEVTYYALPYTQPIEKAYAVYDVSSDRWLVRPPELPGDPKSLYPRDWYDRADSDNSVSTALSARHRAITEHLGRALPGSAEWHNLSSQLKLTSAQAASLYGDIHTGRKIAFGEQGKGYGDWHNFRWQRAKQNGTVAALSAIVTASEASRQAQETVLYGRPLEGAEELLWRAVQQHSSGSYST